MYQALGRKPATTDTRLPHKQTDRSFEGPAVLRIATPGAHHALAQRAPELWDVALLPELTLKHANGLANAAVDLHTVFHQTTSVQNGAVITTAKGFADGIE